MKREKMNSNRKRKKTKRQLGEEDGEVERGKKKRREK